MTEAMVALQQAVTPIQSGYFLQNAKVWQKQQQDDETWEEAELELKNLSALTKHLDLIDNINDAMLTRYRTELSLTSMKAVQID